MGMVRHDTCEALLAIRALSVFPDRLFCHSYQRSTAFRGASPAIFGTANLRSADEILLQHLWKLRFGAELPGGLHDL